MEKVITGKLDNPLALANLFSSLDPILGFSNVLVTFGVAAAILAILLAVGRAVLFCNDEVRAATTKRIIRILIFISIVSFLPVIGAQIFVSLGGSSYIASPLGRL